MSKELQSIRGMKDVLPFDVWRWQRLEDIFRTVASAYGYKEIRTPYLERSDVFVRAIGQETDVVEKEMYSFHDRNDESICLRPEGTAGLVRSCIEHNLIAQQATAKLWYMGPMFRYERPQKGRSRQFSQIGVEFLGEKSYFCEVEIISMLVHLWKSLGIYKHTKLFINSIGGDSTRAKYKQSLVEYYKNHLDKLDEDSKRRLDTNPLRILDSKHEGTKSLFYAAPKIIDFLSDEEKLTFSSIQESLIDIGVSFEVDSSLVRGLDYYNDIVFEWKIDSGLLGSQDTICGGGRYDTLTQQFGYNPTPAIGFAIGMERLLIALEESKSSLFSEPPPSCQVYFVCKGIAAQKKALQLQSEILSWIPNVTTMIDLSNSSIKNMMKKADKSGALYAIILGDNEVDKNVIALKSLRKVELEEGVDADFKNHQQEIEYDNVCHTLLKALRGN